MITEISPKLFRYDLEQPPLEWSTTFHNNEDSYNDSILGYKNKAGLFFFTDSINIAVELGRIASEKENRDKYFLTTLEEFDFPVKLIDFSENDNIYFMLYSLMEMGIDVLTNQFKTFNNDQNFGEFKSIFNSAVSALKENDIRKWRKLIDQLRIGTNSGEHFHVFGQRLTDFDNGIVFKYLVKSLYPDINGYRWKENHIGFTYCLFDSDKLPNVKKVETISL